MLNLLFFFRFSGVEINTLEVDSICLHRKHKQWTVFMVMVSEVNCAYVDCKGFFNLHLFS